MAEAFPEIDVLDVGRLLLNDVLSDPHVDVALVGDDIESQAHQALTNLGRIPEAAGSSRDKVVKINYLGLPLMVWPNTVLPVGTNENRPDDEYADGVVYHVFSLDEGVVATARMPALDGSIRTSVEARRDTTQIEVSVRGAIPTGTRQPWSVLLRGVENVASVAGGTAQANELGVRGVPDVGAPSVALRLKESV
jgi:hypothetical protein